MNILYLIFIQPIVFLLKIIFLASYEITQNYGVSLISISLVITLITIPLYYIAERWKRAETDIQDKMAVELKSVKDNYTGQKRYYLTQAVYRLYGYNPLYSIRVSFGILIQVPFFLAAYSYLSHFTGYQGVPFLFINDLGHPDTLLFGKALLPYVMTIVNLATSWVYTKDKKFSDKLQLFIMALAFLILLYDRPAALLIYWTMNNVFGIFKTWLFMKIFPPLQNKKTQGETFREWFLNIKNKLTPRHMVYGVLALYILQSAWHDKVERTYEYLIPVMGMLTLIFSLWLLVKILKEDGIAGLGKKKGLTLALVILWVLQIAGGIFWVFRFNTTVVSQNTMKRLITIIQDSILLISLVHLIPFHKETKINLMERLPRQNKIFFASLSFLGIFFFIASPLLIYASSPIDVKATPWLLLAKGLVPLILFVFIPGILFLIQRPQRKVYFLQGIVTLVMMVIFYYYLFPSDYGVFNGLSLEKYQVFFSQSLFFYFLDIIIIIVFINFSQWLLKSANRGLWLLLVLLSISLLGQTVYETLTVDSHIISEANKETSLELPDNYKEIHSYSKNEPNIVYFVADMFVGGYVKDIIEEDLSVKEALEGFVWYPDTLSVSYRTVTSMPAMFGGWDYTPKAFNEKAGRNRLKYEEAFKKMADPFINKGYSLSVVNPQFLNMESLYPQGQVLQNNSWDYRRYWESLPGSDKVKVKNSYTTLFSMAALMKASPYSQRKFLYDHSGWIFLSTAGKFANIWDKVLDQRPFLQLLPKISNTDSENPTFKYFHSDFTHSPFGVDKEGNMVIDSYPDPQQNNFDYGKAAYYTAHNFMQIFSDYLKWLKDAGIYDNTTIILVSDHGNDLTTDDPYIPDNLRGISKEEFTRSHALLMVKKAGNQQPFVIDSRFLSNADVPAIIRGEEDDPTQGEAQDRTLYYYHVWGNWNSYLDEEEGSYKSYAVTGSMFNGENWIGE